MIGKVIIGTSFRGCLMYCLNDKLQKHQQETVIKDRAEVLLFNKCYGDQNELIEQFNDVKRLNPKLSKPVMHITLSLAPGEDLSKDKWMEMTYQCAKDMGFENNQYVAIHHRDTDHQHMHIVANRVGYDKRTVNDSNSYKKIAAYCRKMELQYNLKQVLSPRQFLSKEQWQIPRLDQRKERLKENIRQCLSSSQSYWHFEASMKERGYQVLKGRGISFLDDKGVKVKGSEIGYSLMRIEQVLTSKSVLQQRNEMVEKEVLYRKNNMDSPLRKQFNHQTHISEDKQQENSLARTLESLLQPEKNQEGIDPHLVKKKRKKQKRSHHL